MGKLLEELILQRLQSPLDGENSLLQNKFRFRKGRSTVDTIQAMVIIATNAQRGTGKRKGICALISIDMRNAFNTARWNICIEAMMQKKDPDYLLRMIDDYLSDRWVIYEGDKWSLIEEMTCGAPQGSRVGPLVWHVMYDDFLRLKLPASAKPMMHLSCVPLKTLESLINESLWRATRWLDSSGLKMDPERPRLHWSRTGDFCDTQESFPENMRLSGKQTSSTWGCSWIERLASANIFRSQMPRSFNVEQAWLSSCPT